MNANEFLYSYLNNASPTGFEASGQKIWLDYIQPFIDEKIIDTYGTAVGVINPGQPYKVVIEAHADEISWFVNYISPELPEVKMDDQDVSKSLQDLQKEIDKLYKKLAREGYFFKLFNLIPNDKEKQIIQSKITELTNKIEQTIDDKKTLKKFLDENNYEYKDLNNPHHVFDVYYKLKKDAYRLRNSKSELNVKNFKVLYEAPGEYVKQS